MYDLVLRLFITAQTPRSVSAVENLRAICENELQGKYKLEIIDVLQKPQLAEDCKILATPTLIKSYPLPLKRIIGDLSDTELVLLGLDLKRNNIRENAG